MKVSAHVRIPDVFLDALAFINDYPGDDYLFANGGVPGPKQVGKKPLSTRHRDLLTALIQYLEIQILFLEAHRCRNILLENQVLKRSPRARALFFSGHKWRSI